MAKYGDKSNSLSSLFGKSNPQATKSSKFISSASLDSLGNQIESAGYVRAELENKERLVPTIDFSRPANFAKYGSAEQYYKTSIERIYKAYPYDGSKKEKIQWSLSSSYLDNYIFENEYPRTNGFVMFERLPTGFPADSFTFPAAATGENYTLAISPQYIYVKGGPNKASLPIYDQELNKATDFKNAEHKANFYDTANNREKNITINGETGNTIELWFNAHEQSNTTRCFFDVWNNDGTSNTQIASASYGRIILESRVNLLGQPLDSALLHFTYMSGTSGGAQRVPIFSLSDISFSTDTWNHYAITVKNSGDETADKGLRIKTFLNGNLVDNILTGSSVAEVTGSPLGGINANINAYLNYPTEDIKGAALAQSPSITNFNGFANNSGSIDEFRFWKTARTEKQIGDNWFTQVGAGTNTDTSNTDLGFYFKFNEGKTGDSNLDQTILDYSGRVSNGLYVNYDSDKRQTGSAMVISNAAEREFKDPILYPSHPLVSSYKEEAMKKGEEWDYRNPAFLFNTLPQWIQDEDSNSGRDTTLALTQIISSYFDTLHLQIQEIPKIKTNRYLSSSMDTTVKPIPFSSKLLKNAGFVTPEIFADTDVISALAHRDDHREYEKKLYDVKNYIYQNIYNNLSFINKSKGTQKAIRNLIRCFGVDDEIYKINMYADNAEYTLTNNFVDKSVRKTYADFNDVTRNASTVYSFKNSSEPDNFGFITGSTNTSSGFDSELAMTVEAEVILPKKPELGTNSGANKYFPYVSSSLFGMHSAKADPGSDDQQVMTWDANDYANFQVYAVAATAARDEQQSRSVQFVLKSYNDVIPLMASEFYLDQYQDTKWNFAVRVKPKGYPYAGSEITGSTGKEYDVEFEGVSAISDIVINSFKITGSITNTAGLRFLTQKKRMYAGAHRTNFTGSLRERSDVLVSSCRYWADEITSDELKFHAIDPSSVGVNNPEKNAYLFATRYYQNIEVPRIKTLLLNWDFNNVTGSDASGRFVVQDRSYTINQDDNYQLWGLDQKNLLESNHDARGDFFVENSTDSVLNDFLPSYKQQLPENINDSNMITIAETDDLAFTKNTLPIKFSFGLEKSMYQTISEEMINFFYASKEASALENLIGDPVNRYRISYKGLEKFRNLFFNTVGNTPDLEKYLNFYKWLDESVSQMVAELVPVSAKLTGVTNVVESHMLDRAGKYQTKFPTVESKVGVLEDAARGINEMLYDWEFGHAPISGKQQDNCLWWKKRAIRTTDGLWSGDDNVDNDRKFIHSASVQVLNRKLDTTIRLKADNMGLRQSLNKRQFIFAETPPVTDENIKFNTSTFSKPVTCNDTTKINPQFKFKPQFKIEPGAEEGSSYLGRMNSPVTFYSSSIGDQNTDPTGYFKTSQHLLDYYSETKDVPAQGPFTQAHVGGYQYRHSGLNAGVAPGYGGRREGWHTTTSTVGGSTYFVIYNPSSINSAHPRAGYSRDLIAKSSVNIKNIKTITSSNDPGSGITDDTGATIPLGNYTHDYEIVQIPGRSINNKYFIENSGIGTGSTESTFVSGLYDRTIPDRGKNKYVFVNKFSAPGGPETMGAGYLDVESESFSVYNALPFRNLSVRSPLRSLLTKHAAFGGYDSEFGQPSASFHKTPRNGAKKLNINGKPDIGSHDGLGLDVVTSSVFDNAFVQHMIPRSDMQYSWITASAISSIFGYEQPNGSNASLASTDITFVSASDFGTFIDTSVLPSGKPVLGRPQDQAGANFYPQPFVPFNNFAFPDPSQISENTISLNFNTDFVGATLVNGAVGGAVPPQGLNLQLLANNGAGGFSSWKQLRQGDNPIVKDMRRNNRLSFVRTQDTLTTETVFNIILNKNITISRNVEEEKLFSYTEPMVSSKYKPLYHRINMWNYDSENGFGGPQVVLESSYGNNLAYFTMTNTLGVAGVFDSLTKTIGFQPLELPKQVYDDLKRIYINNELDGPKAGSNPIRQVGQFKYRETVYPKESFTFLAKTRMRENYDEASGSADFNRSLGKARTFWKDYSTNRLRSIGIAKNSMGIIIDGGSFRETSYEGVLDLSCWPLDAHYPMVDIAPTGAGGTLQGATEDGQGEGSYRLPTDINLRTLNGELSYNNWIYNLYRVPIQGHAASEPSTLGGTSPTTASLSYEYPNFALSGNDPNQTSLPYTLSHLGLVPNWTANLTSSRNPWFNSYDEYSNDIRRIGKDYTVIPEFRITDHMDYYLKEGNGFKSKNSKYLDLIGSSTSNTSSATSEDSTSLNEEFYRIYSHSDFMKHFEVLRTDHVSTPVSTDNNVLVPARIKISCKGIKKLLPYQGFYPVTRTVQLGQMFSASYAENLTGSYDTKSSIDGDQERQQLSSLIQPFFAPGIMFNTIKSGIAVDWPVITGSIESKNPLDISTGSASIYGYRAAGMCNFDPDWRMPFDAVLSPNKFLPKFKAENFSLALEDKPKPFIYHMWPNYSNASLQQSNQAKRFTRKLGEEYKTWYQDAGYDRPTPNFAWKGDYDNKYNLAMHNFLAETVDFFLENQKVTSFVSKQEKDFKTMVSGTIYTMDVVLRKTDNFKMYEGPENVYKVSSFATSSNIQHTSSVSVRGMHYGPNFASRKLEDQMHTEQISILQQMEDPSPAPYTPPYFYGTSVARIKFRPHALRENMGIGEADKFTLSEIFSAAEIETKYFNENENSNNVFAGSQASQVNTASAAFKNQMSVASSVNLFNRTGIKFNSYEPVVGAGGDITYLKKAVTSAQDSNQDVWVIESKFECPTLDYSDHDISVGSIINAVAEERDATTGPWRTFGKIPEVKEGIFMEIRESYPQASEATDADIEGSLDPTVRGGVTDPLTQRLSARLEFTDVTGETKSIPRYGSLKDICGFETETKRVGTLASSKVVSEAIIAIPILTDDTPILIDQDAFNVQKNNLETKGFAVDAGELGSPVKIQDTSITDMIKKMKKYVIPPHMDFLNNANVDPFVMYIFEFSHELSKKDLSLIWQNMMPDISVTAEQAEATIEHPVLTGPGLEFFGKDINSINPKNVLDVSIFPPKLRWQVFKVKQRAKNNYFGMSITQDAQKGFGLSELNPDGNLLETGDQLTYSYNWPYDFFSLVELAKIEPEISFEPNSIANFAGPNPSGPVPGPTTTGEPNLEDRVKREYADKRNVSTVGTEESKNKINVGNLTQQDIKQ